MLCGMDYIDSDPCDLHPERSPRIFVFDENLELIAQPHDAAKRLPENLKSAVRDTIRALGERRHRLEHTAMITPTLSARIVDLEGATTHCTAVVLQDLGEGAGAAR